MRSLLHDYLATDGNVSYRSGQAPEGNVNTFARNQRDKTKVRCICSLKKKPHSLTLFKRLFKLSDVDAKSVDIATEREDLESILKSSVPGLVSSSKRPIGATNNDSNQLYDGAATGHKLLIEPS